MIPLVTLLMGSCIAAMEMWNYSFKVSKYWKLNIAVYFMEVAFIHPSWHNHACQD